MPRSFTSSLYRAARASATVRSVRTGHTMRRAKNIAVGRAMSPVLRRLWK